MVVLAKRKDQRVLAVLLSALDQLPTTERAVEAGSEMLDMQKEREDCKAADYDAALRERFSS